MRSACPQWRAWAALGQLGSLATTASHGVMPQMATTVFVLLGLASSDLRGGALPPLPELLLSVGRAPWLCWRQKGHP